MESAFLERGPSSYVTRVRLRRPFMPERRAIGPLAGAGPRRLSLRRDRRPAQVDDYVYSTRSDNEPRKRSEGKSATKTKTEATRDELLAKKREYSVAPRVWEAWSDSSILHEEKLPKLVQDNYATAYDTVYGGWRDSDTREWLVGQGNLRSDAQVKSDELVALMSEKHNGVRTNNTVESPLQRIRQAFSNGVESAECQLSAILESITIRATRRTATPRTENKWEDVKEVAQKKATQMKVDATEAAKTRAKEASKSPSSFSKSASAASKSAKTDL
ncbi:hypothetical protein DL93DRAFT_2102672 [Clavulina sp. PMI_390]|nr:hypothetical protein DL93DRAFT_2102672 [Clavulina sp. PMI_390]